MKLIKGEDIKILSDDSSIVPVLKEQGWIVEGEEPSDDIVALREEAAALGIKVHHKTGAEKIRELIASARGE